MNDDKPNSMPMEKVYEIIGRMYLQLWSAEESHNLMARQISDLSEKLRFFEQIKNEKIVG